MKSSISKFTLAALIGIGLTLGSCGGEATEAGGKPTTNNSGNADSGSQEGTTSENSKIVDAYLVLKDALVATDGAKAGEAAQALVSAAGNNENDLAKKISADAGKIAGTQDVAEQRNHFESLSSNVYEFAKSQNSGKKLYKQFCPMAFDGKGAFWISSESEIMNPYFGDMMLHCGKIQEEI